MFNRYDVAVCFTHDPARKWRVMYFNVSAVNAEQACMVTRWRYPLVLATADMQAIQPGFAPVKLQTMEGVCRVRFEGQQIAA